MGHMATRELQDPLPSERVFERLLTRRTLAANEGPFPARVTALCSKHAVAVLLQLCQRGQPSVVAPLRLRRLLMSVRGGCWPNGRLRTEAVHFGIVRSKSVSGA